MPSELYAPGVVPPPHLSPFVDNEEEGYTPEFAHTIRQLQVRVWVAALFVFFGVGMQLRLLLCALQGRSLQL
jgi:hypothetical protein